MMLKNDIFQVKAKEDANIWNWETRKYIKRRVKIKTTRIQLSRYFRCRILMVN